MSETTPLDLVLCCSADDFNATRSTPIAGTSWDSVQVVREFFIQRQKWPHVVKNECKTNRFAADELS